MLCESLPNLAGDRIGHVFFWVSEGRVALLHGDAEEDLGHTRERPQSRTQTHEGEQHTIQNQLIGSSFGKFLEGQGTREETIAVASKHVLSWQLAQAMEREHLTAAGTSERTETTEGGVARLLDSADESAQIGTHRRAVYASPWGPRCDRS